MSKKTNKNRHSDSHASDRHPTSLESPHTNGVLSNTERRLLKQRIAELERVVAAYQATTARDSVSPISKHRSKPRDKTKRLVLQNPLTATKRATSSSTGAGKGAIKPSKSFAQLDDQFTDYDLSLDAELEEDDEYDEYEDYDDLDTYDDLEELEEVDMSDVASVESSFDDSSSIASGSTLPYLDASGFGRDGEADADTVKKFRENLERNQVLVLPSMLDGYPSLLNHNFGGMTTLQLVIQRRSLELLKMLLENPQLDINERYQHGHNVAHWLLLDVEPLESHHVECLALILKLRPDFAFLEDDATGNPPLWYAVLRAQSYAQMIAMNSGHASIAEKAQSQMDQYLKCVQILASYDPNATGKNKLPVLSLAIQFGFIEAFDILMAAKANPNLQDHAGDTPLHHLLNAMAEMNFARAVSGNLHSHHPSSSGDSFSSFSSVASVASPTLATPSPGTPQLSSSANHTIQGSTNAMRGLSSSANSNQAIAPSTPSKVTSMELNRSKDLSSVMSPLSPRSMGAVSTTSNGNVATSLSSSSIRLTRSLNVDVAEDVPGVRLTETVRHMCTALLKENANIYLANYQQLTPYAKSLLRPEIHTMFENYNPGTKVWKYRITSLEMGERIGHGAFGEVYLAKLHGSEFAVKMIELAEASKHEAGIMTDIRHPNILTFVGMYIPPSGPDGPTDRVGLVTEYMPMGSLSNYLGFRKGASPAPVVIAWPMMMRIALTVARGMAWLHSREPAIYHHDLHAGNVLLATELGDTKLCDFGLSRVHGRVPAQHYDRIRAPEQTLGPASDIYCFGFLLYQLLYAEKATKDRINTLINHFSSGLAGASDLSSVDIKIKMRRPWTKAPPGFALLDPDPWPHGSNVCYFDIAHLIVQCTLTDPNARPSFEKIVALLERLSTPQTLIRAVPSFVPATPSGYSQPSNNAHHSSAHMDPVTSGYIDS
jgi:serine/threonine protein kinase/ankyrin repeat protein